MNHNNQQGRGRRWATVGLVAAQLLSLAGAAAAAPPLKLEPVAAAPARVAVKALPQQRVALPIQVDLPVKAGEVQSALTSLVDCAEGSRSDQARLLFDGALLEPGLRRRVDRVLSKGGAAELVIRLNAFTWQVGAAKPFARAEVTFEQRLVDPQAEVGAVVRHSFEADHETAGSYDLVRVPLHDLGSAEELTVLVNSTLGAVCEAQVSGVRAAAVLRAQISLEVSP